MRKYFFIMLFLLIFSCARNGRNESAPELPLVNVETHVIEEEFIIDTSVPRPIAADPAEVINWDQSAWRDARYELFSWDIFADTDSPVLIFDYADYGVQNRMLKRLAFFVEKADFRGSLWHDSEIANLHGWNAHDYRAFDLARFFDAARKENFPLLDEEWELEKILLNEKIIRMEAGNILPGKGASGGAVISIARESAEYLRWQFMAHEGFHALYFADEEFRVFCRARWEQFPNDAKRFITAYFDNQRYDINDEYLLVNEFMGHIMQQNVSLAADYFGRHLPSRLENTKYASELPLKDFETGSWPSLAKIFTEEAQVLSDYVNKRWGFAAGRAWSRR